MRSGVSASRRAAVTSAPSPFICKNWDLRFPSLSREITTCHSSFGGECGERIDSVKDSIGCLEQHPSQATGYGTGFAGASDPRALTRRRVLDRIDSASPIMLGPCDEWRNPALTDGSNPDFYSSSADARIRGRPVPAQAAAWPCHVSPAKGQALRQAQEISLMPLSSPLAPPRLKRSTLHRTRALPPSPCTSLLSNRLKRILRAARRGLRGISNSRTGRNRSGNLASQKAPRPRTQPPPRHPAPLRIGRVFPMLRPCRSRQAARSSDGRA